MILITAGSVELRDLCLCCFASVLFINICHRDIRRGRNIHVSRCLTFMSHFKIVSLRWAVLCMHAHRLTDIHKHAWICRLITSVDTHPQIIALLVMCVCVCG